MPPPSPINRAQFLSSLIERCALFNISHTPQYNMQLEPRIRGRVLCTYTIYKIKKYVFSEISPKYVQKSSLKLPVYDLISLASLKNKQLLYIHERGENAKFYSL